MHATILIRFEGRLHNGTFVIAKEFTKEHWLSSTNQFSKVLEESIKDSLHQFNGIRHDGTVNTVGFGELDNLMNVPSGKYRCSQKGLTDKLRGSTYKNV